MPSPQNMPSLAKPAVPRRLSEEAWSAFFLAARMSVRRRRRKGLIDQWDHNAAILARQLKDGIVNRRGYIAFQHLIEILAGPNPPRGKRWTGNLIRLYERTRQSLKAAGRDGFLEAYAQALAPLGEPLPPKTLLECWQNRSTPALAAYVVLEEITGYTRDYLPQLLSKARQRRREDKDRPNPILALRPPRSRTSPK